MEWISVKDRLPEAGAVVDIWVPASWRDEGGARIPNAGYDGRRFHNRSTHGDWAGAPYDDVTHWMPLPQPPKEE